jgi:hypothetical protein
MKKALLIPALALTMAGSVLFATQTFAQGTSGTDPHMTIIQKLAEKFNLNQSDVQAVFDEARDEHHAEMEKNFEEKLSQLVTHGKITEDQKTKIIAKKAEMEANRERNHESFTSMTPEERRAVMEKQRDALKQWADDNGIAVQYLFGFGRGGHMMRGF